MYVNWEKCEGGQWCELNLVALHDPHFNDMEGVYVIWHGGQYGQTVRVGQGVIKDRVAAHRNDPAVQQYAVWVLYVTWARVPIGQRSGVERFLANRLQPLVGSLWPEVTPIEVNLPWE